MTATDKPSAEELADAIEAKLKDPCGEYIISALEGSVIIPALRRPSVAGATDKPSAGELADSLLDCAIEQIIKGLFPLGSTRDRSITADRAWDGLRHDLKTQIKIWLPVAGAEVGATDPNYKWGLDYGKDLLKDLNQLAHAAGTGALHRDMLQRAYREIKRLSTPVAERGGGGAGGTGPRCTCPGESDETPHDGKRCEIHGCHLSGALCTSLPISIRCPDCPSLPSTARTPTPETGDGSETRQTSIDRSNQVYDHELGEWVSRDKY